MDKLTVEQIAINLRARLERECPPMYQCKTWSTKLTGELKEAGYSAKLIRGTVNLGTQRSRNLSSDRYRYWDHYWVEVGGKIIDITSDQFKGDSKTFKCKKVKIVTIRSRDYVHKFHHECHW